jgi:hypothetical protein
MTKVKVIAAPVSAANKQRIEEMLASDAHQWRLEQARKLIQEYERTRKRRRPRVRLPKVKER